MSGQTGWDLTPWIIAGDFTFATNNARDFRKLYAKQEVRAGLIIILPQILPQLQREFFSLILQKLASGEDLANEAIEISLDGGDAVLTRYQLPET